MIDPVCNTAALRFGYRRIHWVVLGAVGLLGWLACQGTAAEPAKDSKAPTADAANQPGGAEAKSKDLPLAKIVMFNAGVGYFEHRGTVAGDAAVDLKFNVRDINDLLMSMVLEDQGGGRISTVTYGSKDPITKTLQTFAIDLTGNPTLGQILNQMRGEKVSIDAPNNISGLIVGLEHRQKEAGKDRPALDVEYLNLLTDEGLRSVAVEQIGHIRLLDAKLDAEFRQALKVLALSHATDKKVVTLNFLGNGQRPVRVGYIQETPVWKTSYRLVLGDEGGPLLQGWAIVENTTEEDWNKVNLTLVSGRPISFVMDLYQPLYVQRPVVEPELYASLRPQTYNQDLEQAEAEFREKRRAEAAAAPAAPGLGRKAASDRQLLQLGAAAGIAGRNRYGYAAAGEQDAAKQANMSAMQLRASAPSMAQGGDVGELFQYVIATPVTLPRHESAMLPIVNESVKGEKVSIYNQHVQAKHPLNGLRLKNTTDLHLMQGPITVFDDGAFAGDARIEDMQPGTERLISYALDLGTEVAPSTVGQPQRLVSVRIAKGTLFTEYRLTRETDYTVKNSGKKAKKVLIEYPLEAQWKLIEPEKPTEKTRDLYRFAVNAEPGQPAKLAVKEEQIVRQQWAVNNLDEGAIGLYLSEQVVSARVKDALREIIAQKRAIQDVAQRRRQAEQQVAEISQEQDRIRRNMVELDRTADLYKKYVMKLSAQEEQIDKLHEQSKELQGQETRLQKKLEDFILSLDLS